MTRRPWSRRRLTRASSALLQWVRVIAFVLILLLVLALLAPVALTSMAGELPETLRRAATAGGSAVSAILKLPLSAIGFLTLLLLALAVALWTALSRPLAVIRPGLKLLLDRLVQVIALAILFPLLAFFFKASLDSKPDTTKIVALAAMVLVVALFLGGGPLLLSRLKKLGPLELFESAEPVLVNRLSLLIERMNKDVGPVLGESSAERQGLPSRAALEESRRADAIILLFEALGEAETLTGAAKRNLGTLLWSVGNFAVQRHDWPIARQRLERLQRLLGESYDRNEITDNLPYKLAYNLGWSYLGPVLDSRDPEEQGFTKDQDPRAKKERKRLLRLALDSFSRAAEEDPYSRDALFYRAWVEDELGMWDLAIDSNKLVLRLSPHDAPAKYNLAISLIKKEKLDLALEQLGTINARDREGRTVLELALSDQDLEPLRRHPSYRAQLTWSLRRALLRPESADEGES